MFSRLFIDRPIFAAVLSLFIVIAGLAAMRNLPIAQYPEIAPPVVTVTANYPGASAAVNINNRVRQVEPRLPQDVRRLGVTVEKSSSSFLMVAAFYSPQSRYDSLYISNFVAMNVLDVVKRIPGTTNVQIFGAKD